MQADSGSADTLVAQLISRLWPGRSIEDRVALLLGSVGAVLAGGMAILRLAEGKWATFAVDVLLVVCVCALLLRVAAHGARLVLRLLMVLAYLAAVLSGSVMNPQETYLWAYPCMVATYFLLPPVLALAVNTPAYLGLLGILWSGVETASFVTAVLTLTFMNLIGLFFAEQNRYQRHQLDELASRDALTGAYNRRALEPDLTRALRDHQRHGRDAALILFDLDRFKPINDDHGHEVGDQVLREVVRRAACVLGVKDRLYRHGGEEFLVLARETSADELLVRAERLRASVRDQRLNGLIVTISAGVAGVDDHADVPAWVAAADQAMYRAKRAGRDRVEAAVAGSEAPQAYLVNP